MPATKIATCCYCGSRTALRLRGKERHELTCASCAAPLHNLKMFPVTPGMATAPAATPARPARRAEQPKYAQPRRPAKKRKVGRFARKLWEEIWDELEDIFD
ncbi:hypothetical protein [Yoonia sp.]|uniref:hypothetical protein n=1 Tax=Yoonia sp. TaxID=2212373 RepID=UPI003F6C6F0F